MSLGEPVKRVETDEFVDLGRGDEARVRNRVQVAGGGPFAGAWAARPRAALALKSLVILESA